MNLLTVTIPLGAALVIYAFILSFTHFKNKKFPTLYNVREYKDGVLTAEYKEVSGYKERVPNPPPHLEKQINSGEIREEPVSQAINSEAPPKKIGRPKMREDNKIIVEYDEMSL